MAVKCVPLHILLNVIFILFSISACLASLSDPLNSNTGNDASHNLVCKCLSKAKSCEVTISSGILTAVKCQEGEHYCCSIDYKTTDRVTYTPETSGTPKVEPRVKIVLPTPPEKVVTPESKKVENVKCKCKLRRNCPEEYTDYSLNFNCSYVTVRCCEPVTGQIDGGIYYAGGRRTKMSEVNLMNKTRENCLCLPMSNCLTKKEDQMMKKRDMACPNNLVQCCGDSIVLDKRNDDSYDPDMDDHNDSLEKLDNPDQLEQPGPRQPIQLPLMKIPLTPSPVPIEPSTLPPPTLPIKYHYYSPTQNYYNRNLYTPVVETPPVRQRPSHYYTGSPLMSRYENPYLINNNGRGFTETGRSSTTSVGSFLRGLASYIG